MRSFVNHCDCHSENSSIKDTSLDEYGELPTVTLHQASLFLYTFNAQVVAAMAELKMIDDSKKRMDVNNLGPLEEQKLLEDEKFANQLFLRLRRHLVQFMDQNHGIRLL